MQTQLFEAVRHDGKCEHVCFFGLINKFMQLKNYKHHLVLIFVIAVYIIFSMFRNRSPENLKKNYIYNDPQAVGDGVVLVSKSPQKMSKSIQSFDSQSQDLRGFQKSVEFLIYTQDFIREIPESQPNVIREAKAIGRIFFMDDWSVLRLKYPKLPKSLGENLYKAIVESVATSNNFDVLDWISNHLEGVTFEDVLRSNSADAASIMNRHYQWILDDPRRSSLMNVAHKLDGKIESHSLFGSSILMDLWGYGFLKSEAQSWEDQRLDTSLPLDMARTTEERALFSQPSPGLVRDAGEERRWFQDMHRGLIAWRLSHIHELRDPFEILEIVESIRLDNAHHFGWPDP